MMITEHAIGLNKAARARVEQIRHKHKLTVRSVLSDAEDPKSPLHKYFDWDDTEAAKKWRVHQAQRLICAVQVYIPTHKPEHTSVRVRKYWRGKPHVYDEVKTVLRKKESREYVLAQVLRELERIRTTYAHLSELAEVFAAIDKVAKKPRKKVAN